jgi:asparagine synthase (glutamine-hydrolysing)
MQAISIAEILGYMEPMLLRDSDQMSMAVSLELRVPLLDHRLVEFVLSLPEKWKRGRPPKRLLIDSFADILPNEVWNRPKQGFALPMDDWMRGPLQDFCRHGVNAARARLDAHFVDSAVVAFQEKKLHWTRLWQIAVLGHYSEKST